MDLFQGAGEAGWVQWALILPNNIAIYGSSTWAPHGVSFFLGGQNENIEVELPYYQEFEASCQMLYLCAVLVALDWGYRSGMDFL